MSIAESYDAMHAAINNATRLFLSLMWVPFIFSIFPSIAQSGITARYLYKLSDFSGTIPYSQVRVSVDSQHNEVYVDDGGSVRIFNESGMEIYSFLETQELGGIYGIVVDEDGDIYLLSYDYPPSDYPSAEGIAKRRFYLCRCNYRGKLIEKITLSNLPPEYSEYGPNCMYYRNGRFFFANLRGMTAIVTDKRGVFEKGFNFGAIIGVDENERPDTEFFGFYVDREENFYFTVPVNFKAYKVSPEGKVFSFGKPGGAPGMFGVVSGIAVDNDGNIFVTDKLKCVVMVFNRNFKFLTEFGFRGSAPGNLIAPASVALGNNGQVYVTQSPKAGVSVFSVTAN
ncbi:MAG: hypothetical protein ACM31N_03025 [Deltaproteobacteria bacterium]